MFDSKHGVHHKHSLVTQICYGCIGVGLTVLGGYMKYLYKVSKRVECDYLELDSLLFFKN